MNVTWCLVYFLPFPWHMMFPADASGVGLAYALRDCNGDSLLLNQQRIAAYTQQSARDGLGTFLPVHAWSSIAPSMDASARASICRDAIASTNSVPPQVMCNSVQPMLSWWNHTTVEVLLVPVTRNDDMVRRDPETERQILYMMLALAVVIFLLAVHIPGRKSIGPPPVFVAQSTHVATNLHIDAYDANDDMPPRPYVDDEDGTYFSPYGNIRNVPDEERAALRDDASPSEHFIDAL